MKRSRKAIEDDEVEQIAVPLTECTTLDHIYPDNNDPNAKCYCGKRRRRPFIDLEDYLKPGMYVRTVPGGPIYEVEMVNRDNTSPETVSMLPTTTSGGRGPRCPTSQPDSGANTTVIAAIGNVSKPACNAENPRTDCRYSEFRNRNPDNAENPQTAISVAPENGALRKNRGSSSGSSRRRSYRTSDTNAAAQSTKHPMISGEPHPADCPSMIAYTRLPSTRTTST